jgi:phage terminase small subunit
VDYYIATHGNAAEAARRAGYAVPNAHRASVQGNKLTSSPRVQAAIAERTVTVEQERHDLAVSALSMLKEIGEDESMSGMARVKAATALLDLAFPGQVRRR